MIGSGGNKGRGLAIVALVILASALGYSTGFQQGTAGATPVWSEAPIEPKTLVLMRDAADRARAEGDTATAQWFDKVAQKQLEQMVNWASRQSTFASRGN